MENELLKEQISDLDKQIIELQNQKSRLEAELNKASFLAPPVQNKVLKPTNNFSPEEKIKIFHQLFRGREDVYARLWISSKTGRNSLVLPELFFPKSA